MMENDLVVDYNKTNNKISLDEKSNLLSEKEVNKIMIEVNKMLLDQISIYIDEIDKLTTENTLLRKKDCHVNSR